MLDAIQFHRRLRHLRKLLGRFAFHGATGGQRLTDRAELTRLGATLVADAGLQDGRRQYIPAMQDGNLRVWDTVRGGQVVEAWTFRKADRPQGNTVPRDTTVAIRIR